MKLLQNVPAITKAIIVAGMLGACQNEKDAVVAPISEQAEKTDNLKTNVAYFYKRLIGDGSTNLSYSGPNKLISYESVTGSGVHTDYDYNNANIIYARTRKSSNYELIETSAYKLNSEGKCSESHHVKSGTTEIFIYKYNPEGRLEKVYKESNPNLRQEFAYVNNGSGKFNLNTINSYDSKGQLIKQTTYSYYTNEEDISKINPTLIVFGRAKYLPIFGSFNFNSIKSVNETNYINQAASSTSSREFSYTWNDDTWTQNVVEKSSIGVNSFKRKYGKLGIL
jgi:hypothetical protein